MHSKVFRHRVMCLCLSPLSILSLCLQSLQFGVSRSAPHRYALGVQPDGRLMRTDVGPNREEREFVAQNSSSVNGWKLDGKGEQFTAKDTVPKETMESADTVAPALSRETTETLVGIADSAPVMLMSDSGLCSLVRPAHAIAKDEVCPEKCPFWAEIKMLERHGSHRKTTSFCHFRCVNSEDCGTAKSVDPNATVADDKRKICRRCNIPGCEVCVRHQDECSVCFSGYDLVEGKCLSVFRHIHWIPLIAISALLVYFLAWYLDLRLRTVANEEGVQDGLRLRSLSKLRMPKMRHGIEQEALPHGTQALSSEPNGAINAGVAATAGESTGSEDQETRPLWPLSTNLLRVPVAGPGTVLHFRYQIAVIIWAVALLLCWMTVAYTSDRRLLHLGMQKATTPLDLCRAVHDGYQVQRSSLWLKCLFLGLAYLASMIGVCIFSVQQLQCYRMLDNHTTMKDFMALMVGLPRLQGQQPVETILKDLLARESGQEVAGVSVCWDFLDHEEPVMQALEESLVRTEAATQQQQQQASLAVTQVQPQGLRWKLFGPLDQLFLDADAYPVSGDVGNSSDAAADGSNNTAEQGSGVVDAPHRVTDDAKALEELLHGLFSTNCAFAVFKTEAARDAALQVFDEKQGAHFNGRRIKLRKVDAEPDTVCWQHFSIEPSRVPKRLFVGILIVLGTLVLWTVLFYLPYASFVFSFAYRDGMEPGTFMSYFLSFVVVGGNLFMYAVCAAVSEKVGFRFGDEREACYMVLYTTAVLMNVSLDMGVTAAVSYRTMVGRGAHTFGGKLISELGTTQDVFESYPMQKSLGNQLFYYCWPSCFFYPFLLEPVFALQLPFHLGKLVLRSHSGVRGRAAERTLTSFMVMDTGRYADVVINMSLTALILFFPTGYLMPTLAALILSHIYIYFYDHYRVLRCVPGFNYASATIDKCAQRLLAVPLGLAVVALIIKRNTDTCDDGRLCLRGRYLWFLCFDVFCVHIAFHWICLDFVVPRFVRGDVHRSDLTFEQAAEEMPCNWFSTNPIYCLRSQAIYKHNPPCLYYFRGKEHLMRKNPEAFVHFEDKEAKVEDFS